MSMPIRHPLRGEPYPSGRSFDPPASDDFAKRVGNIGDWRLAACAWARRSFVSGGGMRAAHKRGRRSLFQNWAATDLAHRDVASQFWPNLRTT